MWFGVVYKFEAPVYGRPGLLGAGAGVCGGCAAEEEEDDDAVFGPSSGPGVLAEGDGQARGELGPGPSDPERGDVGRLGWSLLRPLPCLISSSLLSNSLSAAIGDSPVSLSLDITLLVTTKN